MDQVSGASRWSAASALTRAALQFVQLAISARFLAPYEFGLLALNTIFVSYATVVSDFGLSSAFINRQHVSANERDGIFWLGILITVITCGALVSASPVIAQFFALPELQTLLSVSTLLILATAIGEHLRASAEKKLDFKRLASLEIVSGLVGFTVTMGLLNAKFGVFSLIGGAIAGATIFSVGAWALLSNGWRPRFQIKNVEVVWYMRFGVGMLVNNIINQVNTTLDILILGRLVGAGALGLFSIPRNLVLQIQSAVNPIYTRVGFPLVAASQDDKTRLGNIYSNILNLTASINSPIYIAIFVLAPDIVHLLLGKNWSESIIVLKLLAIWGLLRACLNPLGVLLFGTGRLFMTSIWNLSNAIFIPAVILIGARWGIVGAAAGAVALAGVSIIPAWKFLVFPICSMRLNTYLESFIRPIGAAIVAGVAASVAIMPFSNHWFRMTVAISVGFLTYLYISFKGNRQGYDGIVALLSGSPIYKK